ncbi:DUF3392 domain-containing protein [Thalassomonas viridans]|uniref:DUF3392 domain-containing protein n=1 Tax=Thalassomonas viridans TaxID=137584 RepID=A0AAE9YYA8_9GAMM|nr:DUF3392 domain-containing protein [Thalassomonas viridans]WDE03250.1 DUF3392 domain-containing protein [Thalassomonas viridans]
MISLLTDIGAWLRPYQFQLALAIIATLLVLFGNDINRWIKKLLSGRHFIVRLVVFVLVCAFGYGLATVWLTSMLAQQLARIPNLYFMPACLLAFTLLGLLAQRQRQI